MVIRWIDGVTSAIEIRAREHDRRRLAAELQHDALRRAAPPGRITARPTATEPVKLTMSTAGWPRQHDADVLAADDEIRDAGGILELLQQLEEAPRRERRPLDGRTTAVQPDASTPPSFRARRSSGKL